MMTTIKERSYNTYVRNIIIYSAKWMTVVKFDWVEATMWGKGLRILNQNNQICSDFNWFANRQIFFIIACTVDITTKREYRISVIKNNVYHSIFSSPNIHQEDTSNGCFVWYPHMVDKQSALDWISSYLITDNYHSRITVCISCAINLPISINWIGQLASLLTLTSYHGIQYVMMCWSGLLYTIVQIVLFFCIL